jgi:arylsulfatase A-like enzyme
MQSGARSLRLGDWKLIRPAKGKAELYNIAADPYEKKNLAVEEPARLKELQERLVAEHSLDNPVMPEDLKGFPH